MDRTNVMPAWASTDKAFYTFQSLADAAGIPLTPEIWAAAGPYLDYNGEPDQAGYWFEKEI